MKTARNVAANVGGRLWQILMSFAFVPFYVRFMGVEAYGLIGVFATMLAIFGVLDMGLSLSVNRELARFDAAGDRRRARDLTRTLEYVYWVVAIVIGLSIFLGAALVTQHWLKLNRLSPDTATMAIQLMGGVALLRWPGALYGGVLMGLREHVAFNAITIFGSTLSGFGAVLVLWLVSPSVTAFFGWQIVAAAVQTAFLVIATWRKLRMAGHRPVFATSELRAVARFSSGVFGVTLLSIVLMQLDKLVLSSSLTLVDFGYYTLAFTIGNVLATLGLAIHGALFPSLSHVVAGQDERQIADFYHRCCQLMAVAIIPAALTLTFFAEDLLTLYLGNPSTAAQSRHLVMVFAAANMIFAVMMMPYGLQLAFGWTRLSIYKNSIAIVLYIPALLLLVRDFGAIGGAYAWLGLMLGYLLFEVRMMHRRLLVGEMRRWYLRDVALPILVGFVIVGLARWGSGYLTGSGLHVVAATGGAICATVAIVALSTEMRHWVSGLLCALRRRLQRIHHGLQ